MKVTVRSMPSREWFGQWNEVQTFTHATKLHVSAGGWSVEVGNQSVSAATTTEFEVDVQEDP